MDPTAFASQPRMQVQLDPTSNIMKTVQLPFEHRPIVPMHQARHTPIMQGADYDVLGRRFLNLPNELGRNKEAQAVLKMESTFRPITILDQDVVDLWRAVAKNESLGADADVAKLLLSSFFTGGTANSLRCSRCHNNLSLVCGGCCGQVTVQETPTSSAPSVSQAVRLPPPETLSPSNDEEESFPHFGEDDDVHSVKEVTDIMSEDKRQLVSVSGDKEQLVSVGEDNEQPVSVRKRGRRRKVSKIDSGSSNTSLVSEDLLDQSFSTVKCRAVVNSTLMIDSSVREMRSTCSATKRYRVAGRSYKSKVTLKSKALLRDLIDLGEVFAGQIAQQRKTQHSGGESEIDGEYCKENGKPKVYLPRKSFTLEEFMSGKIQLQIPDRNSKEGWVYSHYFCEQCSRIFEMKEEFDQHHKDIHFIKTESEDFESSKEEVSQTKSTTSDILDGKSLEILMQLKDRLLFCCPHCDLVFNHRRPFSKHVRNHNYKVEKGVFTCLLCKSTFKKLNNLELHMRIPETEDDKCIECGFQFSSWCQVHPHRKVHKKEKKASAKAKSLCSLCGKNVHPHALKDHVARHTTTHQYSCIECPMTFKVEKDLRAHMLTHGEKKFQCENCGLKFFLAKSLKKHVLIKHSNVDVGFKCSLCDKKIQTAKGLQIHVAEVHNKIKPYKCSYCPMMFARRSEVPIHERIHTGDRPFKCEMCPAAFTRMTYLNKHIQAHNGQQRPRHDCQDCNKSFSCLSRYKKHRQKLHSDRVDVQAKAPSGEFSSVKIGMEYPMMPSSVFYTI